MASNSGSPWKKQGGSSRQDSFSAFLVRKLLPDGLRAGVERAMDLSAESDISYLVESIYLAMEYERTSFSVSSGIIHN